MTVEEYNSKRLLEGSLTQAHIAELVKFWQEGHDLLVDGYCGPQTTGSIDAVIVPVISDESSALGIATLAIAIESIGKGEVGGNNSGEFVEMLHGKKFDGNDDDDGSWCASFISWCVEGACSELDVDMPFKRSGGAKRLFKNAGNAGSFVDVPAAGDLVCWDRGRPGSWQGHIGVVERYESGVLYTVEGNVGRFPSKVRRFRHDLDRSRSRIEGFARMP